MNEGHSDSIASIVHLLQLHLMDQLPEGVTVIYIPIKRTYDGECQVASEYHRPFEDDRHSDGACESIEIRRYLIFGRMMFAGYGEETRTLVIGKKSQGDDGLRPAIRAEDVRKRIKELTDQREQDLRNERIDSAQYR